MNTPPDAFGPEQRSLYMALMQALSERYGDAITLQGSLARGEGDAYSDVDLAVRLSAGESPSQIEAAIRAAIPNDLVLASFPATHLGLPNLMVSFFDAGTSVLKLDIMYVGHVGVPPRAGRALHDERAIGWMWYTYTKIARGEIWEAASSLDEMRRSAFLPKLLRARGFPDEGFRHVERRLAANDLRSLERTRPAIVSASSVHDSLAHLSRAYRALLTDDASTLTRLRRMMELCRIDACANGSPV